MKIGVLTFHHVYNYGALLQAYALQRYLVDEGHDVSILNVRPFWRYPARVTSAPRLLRPLLKAALIAGSDLGDEKIRRFNLFRRDHLNLTERYSSLPELIQRSPHLDAIVVGSDQVWNPRFGKSALRTYSLMDLRRKITRVSYAACCGSRFEDVERLSTCADSIGSFDALSVRDEFTREAIEEITGRSAEIVVDPSLLVDWREIDTGSELGELPDRFMFYYGFSRDGDQLATKLAESRGIPIVAAGMENDHARDGFISVADAGPLEWLELIRRAELVVTKSFHGFMLALKHEKQVLVTTVDEKSGSRMRDAASRFGLLPAIVDQASSFSDPEARLDQVAWAKGLDSMERQTRLSKRFLSEALQPRSAITLSELREPVDG